MSKFNFKTVEEVDIHIEKCRKAINNTTKLIEGLKKVNPDSLSITCLTSANASREKHLESLISFRESLLTPIAEVVEEASESTDGTQEIGVDDETNS